MSNQPEQERLRQLPAVDELVRRLHPSKLSRDIIVHIVRDVLAERREILRRPEAAPVDASVEDLLRAAEARIARLQEPSCRRVINASGVILHTNLGRAPLAREAAAAAAEAAGYCNLEYSLREGGRGERAGHVEGLLRLLSGAEAAEVVNNGAAAVLVVLNTLAQGRDVVVSRGELVEIGGSFRVPDVMGKSGARLVEVGTTNKTHLWDYRQAMGAETALLMKVHPSNFRVIGFTSEVGLKDLVQIGRSSGVPVFHDLGSGALADPSPWGLDEPSVRDSIAAGADVVSFSGDKLLGGPQAGIILGRPDLVGRIRANPLMRALRVDKLCLSALAATLRLMLDGDGAARIPVLAMLSAAESTLRRRAMRVAGGLRRMGGTWWSVEVDRDSAPVGGGSSPARDLPTWVVAVTPRRGSAAALERALREGDPPVVARIHRGRPVLDMRTLYDDGEVRALTGAFRRLREQEEGG